MQFLAVYLREAHPVDGVLPERHDGNWLMGSPERGLLFEDPETDAERQAMARLCERRLELGFPMVVDRMDDAVNRAYAAWPDRLYVVDIDGSIVHRGEKGPMGFLPEELAAVLEELVSFYSGDERSR